MCVRRKYTRDSPGLLGHVDDDAKPKRVLTKPLYDSGPLPADISRIRDSRHSQVPSTAPELRVWRFADVLGRRASSSLMRSTGRTHPTDRDLALVCAS